MRLAAAGMGSLALAVGLAAAACPARAQPPRAAPRPPGPPRSSPHAAPVWTVDKAASRISFRASAGGRAVDGVFKRWDAQLAFDPANLHASRLSVVVETASAVTGDPARDAVLPGPAWLAAARFPHATFTSQSFAPAAAGRYAVSGTLTVRGVAKPLSVMLVAQPARDRTELAGGFTLERDAFSLGPAAPGADGAVQVNVRLAARRVR